MSDWKKGDHLLAIVPFGGLAEQTVLPAAHAIRIPEGRDPIEGAGLVFTYATSLHALADRGRLQAGETLLVLGAAGGVGLAAVEIGKAMGARIVAGVSSEDKAAAARAAGADTVFIYPAGPFDPNESKMLAQTIKTAVGAEGAQVIFDPVGGAYTEAAVRSIAWEGRFLVVGFPAGIPNLPLNLTLLKCCDVMGVFWGSFAMRNPARNAEHVRQLIKWWMEGRIRPRIDKVFSLGEGANAISRLASRSAIGKVVVKTNPDPAVS